MIKLKNLWKVAFATLAMSAMLVACDESGGDPEPDDPLAQYKTTPVVGKADSFTYGFKFSTEEGWAAQFISENATTEETFDKTVLNVGKAVKMKTAAGTDKNEKGETYADDSTKIFVDKGELVPAKLYTITYKKRTGEVSLQEAVSGTNATKTDAQETDSDGLYPAGIYISGYLGDNWAGENNPGKAILMDVINPTEEIYSFTWVVPVSTITVTLKITMDVDASGDTSASSSTLYLRDVPVKTDGTSEIDGSIYSWNGGEEDETITAVTIKNVDATKGGIYDAAMTAKNNAAWAFENYCGKDKELMATKNLIADKFELTGADDVLQLSIDAERWVPYIKGQVCTYSWTKAQNKLKEPPKKE